MGAAGRSRGWTLAVHGGAGTMRRLGTAKEADYREGLAKAAAAGVAVLQGGGDALEACIAAVRHMERSGVFNAGRGSCLNRLGQIEADAAVMRASDVSIGAVAAVPGAANAVELAEGVRSLSAHCLLAGAPAIELARAAGWEVEEVEPPPGKLARYRRLLAENGGDGAADRMDRDLDLTQLGGTHDEGDTVGAVALDPSGELALAASTGGIWLKKPGRVGDSPLPGAGFWAEPGLLAVVATGTGEAIIRAMLCRDVAERLRRKVSLERACADAIEALSARFGGGRAGLVAVDAQGRVAMSFDTQGMGRAVATHRDPDPRVAVWPDERLGRKAKT